MVGVTGPQFNAILWTIWGQGTKRLVGEHPNGDTVTDQNERLWRTKTLYERPEMCPHWPAYRDRAEPLAAEAARQLFAGQPDEVALQLLFQQLQAQPWQVVPAMRRISQHADLDRIVEADVWPWLERESGTTQDILEPGRAQTATPSTRLPSDTTSRPPNSPSERKAPPDELDYREQITPLATIAYRLHELGTQVAYIAKREPSDQTDVRSTALDEKSFQTLTACSAILFQHSTYIRLCAVQIRNTALLADQLTRHTSTTPAGGDHQWWIDLTARPITSDIRDEVAGAMTTDEISTLIMRLADESDAMAAEVGDSFERVGWNRGIAAGTTCVGPELRSLSERLRSRPTNHSP